MELSELWLRIRVFIPAFITYMLPILALVLSVFSYIDSRKANKFQERLGDLEEKIKIYELEEKEKQREEATKACVEARIVKYSKNSYRMKIWNSGKATAYNVDFSVPEELKRLIGNDKVPYESLESKKGFEEYVIVHLQFPPKLRVTTSWSDEQGESFSKEQTVSI